MANQPRDVVERLHSEKRREEHEKETQKNIAAIPLKSGQTLYLLAGLSLFIWRGTTLEKEDSDMEKNNNYTFDAI